MKPSLSTLLLLLLLFAAGLACGRTAANVNNQGNEPFANEQYETALEAYEQAQSENPDLGSLRLCVLIGNALVGAGIRPGERMLMMVKDCPDFL